MAESIAGIVLLSASPPTLLFTTFHFQVQNIFKLLLCCLIAFQMAPSRRGALIVVEGLDRAGKSSQCECLRDSLLKSDHSVKYIRFPGIRDIYHIYVDVF